MWDEEKHHRETFERLIVEKRVRPTVLLPLWNIAGFALGNFYQPNFFKVVEVFHGTFWFPLTQVLRKVVVFQSCNALFL